MAEFDVTVGGPAGLPAHQEGMVFIEKIVDLSVINGGVGLAQNDIANAIDVPANTFVFGVLAQVVAGEESSNMTACEIGDGADPNGWIVTKNATAAFVAFSGPVSLTEGAPNTVTGYSAGKFYSAADTIDLKNTTAATVKTGKVRITAWMLTAR